MNDLDITKMPGPDRVGFSFSVSCTGSCHIRELQIAHLVNNVVRVPEERVREAALEEVHRQPRALLDDEVQQYVDGLAVAGVFLAALLRQPQQGGRGQGEELLQAILYVIAAADGEHGTKYLVHRQRQSVDVVLVAVELRLSSVRARMSLQYLHMST